MMKGLLAGGGVLSLLVVLAIMSKTSADNTQEALKVKSHAEEQLDAVKFQNAENRLRLLETQLQAAINEKQKEKIKIQIDELKEELEELNESVK